jgi:hypothetical protein
MELAERELLATTVRDALSRDAAHVDDALAALGWRDMLSAEPDDAIAIVFSALGEANASATALDDVVIAALGVEPTAGRAALLPPYGAWEQPASDGIATSRITTADELVVAHDGGVVMVPASRATTTPLRGIDPDAGLHTVSVDVDAARAAPGGDWNHAVARSRRALAHQIAGASRVMLDLARQHAIERVQFGRPIARFQAVRHRLADSLVAIEALDAVLAAAADAPGPETALLAKAQAGQTARVVATHCQQVLAGIGFTTDHPFHRYLKRTMLLDGLFGRAEDLTLSIGRLLVASRAVPTLIEL